MRVHLLEDRSFWFDEGFAWKMISFPWREMFARVALDNHGPLYYALLKAWAATFGDSPWSLRFFSVTMGELTIFGMYLFASEAFRGRGTDASTAEPAVGAGLAVAALTAVSAFQIQWSCEVRMYTLGTALAAFSSWLLLRALRPAGGGFANWASYAVAALAFVYTHNYALFTIAAQAVFAVGCAAPPRWWRPAAENSKRRLRATASAFGAILLGCLPWLPVFLRQRRQVRESFWLPEVDWRLIADACFQMFAHDQHFSPSEGAAFLAAEACLAVFVVLLWRAKGSDWLVLLLAVCPFALSVAVSAFDTKIFHTHHFLFAHLFFLAAAVAVIHRVRPPLVRRASIAAALAGSLWVFGFYAERRASRAEKPGARAAAAFLDGRRGAGELAVSCSPMLTPTLEGHARDKAGWRTYKPEGEYPHFQGTAVVRPGEYITDRDMEGVRAGRIWTVDAEKWEKGTCIVPTPSHWVLKDERRFPEIYGDGCEIVVREYATAEGPRSRR